jgi:protein-disulfide isomerase
MCACLSNSKSLTILWGFSLLSRIIDQGIGIMKKLLLVSALFVSGGLLANVAIAQDTPTFNAEQTQQIEKITHDYLLSHPEILIEMQTSLQAKQMHKMQAEAVKNAKQNTDELFRSNSPVAGNHDGKVTMVAFLDYQCPFCRKMTESLAQIIKTNPDVKIVFKEFPVHGKNSELAAIAAMSADKQGKYWQMHEELMSISGPVNEQSIMDAAKKVGLDLAKLKKDMHSPEMQKALKDNFELATAKLNIGGTPSFFVAKTNVNNDAADSEIEFIPGAVPLAVMQKTIDKIKQ